MWISLPKLIRNDSTVKRMNNVSWHWGNEQDVALRKINSLTTTSSSEELSGIVSTCKTVMASVFVGSVTSL